MLHMSDYEPLGSSGWTGRVCEQDPNSDAVYVFVKKVIPILLASPVPRLKKPLKHLKLTKEEQREIDEAMKRFRESQGY